MDLESAYVEGIDALDRQGAEQPIQVRNRDLEVATPPRIRAEAAVSFSVGGSARANRPTESKYNAERA